MAQVITVRRLVTELVLRSKPAERALAAYDKLWKATAKGVEDAAARIEKAAARAGGALGSVAAGAGAIRAGAGAAAAGGRGGGSRPARTSDPVIDKIVRSGAMAAGLQAGSAAINANTAALDKNASAADRSRARIKDLTAQVERNRKEMADLKRQAIQAGDATGTLAAREKGLAVATAEANLSLAAERRNLREVTGTAGAAAKVLGHLGKIAGGAGSTLRQALGVAGGNLLSAGTARVIQGVGGSLVGATKAAIDFQSSMADVRKVMPTTTTAEQFKAIEDGVIGISRKIAIAPTQVAALTASLAQAGIAGEELTVTATDAAKLGVAFNITGEEAGTAIAKLRTGLGLNREEVNLLTGSINQLGNNMAATAPQILDVVRRVGSVGRSANLSKEQIAGLGAALVAGGAESEVAATGLKNFTLAMASGEAATKKQSAAFKALGLSAVEIAQEFTSGDVTRSNDAIKKVVAAIGGLADDQKVATIKNLFGSESLGAIGPLANQIELFDKAMGLATDTTAAAVSVQKEYDTRSKTSANSIQLLKNNVEALAIQFGNALLPYIDKVVAFLTSDAGKKWGADAVEKAVTVVTGLADAIGVVASGLGKLIDMFGGAGVAVGIFGAAISALVGPWGLAAAAAVTAGAAFASALDSVINRAQKAEDALLRLHNKAQSIRNQEAQSELDAAHAEFEQVAHEARQKNQAFDAAEKWYEREKKKRGGDKDGSLLKRRNAMEAALISGQYQPGTTFDERLAAFGQDESGGGGGNRMARFQALLAARQHRQLKPSEAVELRKLSTALDLPIPKLKKPRHHKQTKMDRQLAAIGGDVADVLTRGGEEDAGGDLKVSGDVLSRAAFKAATGAHGVGGVGGVGSVGPGPNITNNYYNTSVTVQQAIDARSSAPVPQNIRDAAQDAGQRVGDTAVRFIGAQRVVALRNSGGRLAGV